MKKKVIIIAICILVFGICFTLGYIIMNGKFSKNNNDNVNEKAPEDDIINVENNLDENGNEKFEIVMPNSRIGLDILKHFQISNIYSDEFYKLLDNEGLSDRVKRVWAFIDIMQGKNYVYMLEYSEEGAHTLISKNNMHTAISEIFSESENVSDGELIYNFKFNKDNDYYTIPSVGISKEENRIVVEVPAQIREYNQRYEVDMYRLYMKQYMEETVDVYDQIKMITSVYYDLDMKQKATDIDDIAIYSNLDSQVDVLLSYIENGKIDKYTIQKVKYTLVKNGESYKISKYEKITN